MTDAKNRAYACNAVQFRAVMCVVSGAGQKAQSRHEKAIGERQVKVYEIQGRR